ncbi:MAG: ABC transporter substrate-binding protein [Planctomycetes bacterium]|nr:ABC transporter substrate-binding protein [Planctomycetota bacterium]MCB9870699.1 ABC transporter substrate-binding protein [Planctomycetota bacterium]
MSSSARIVSLVPSLTQSVCDLHRGDRLVAVTRYCAEPEEVVEDLPKIGGTKNPDRERIVALDPDLVLVNTEENRAEDIEWLRARVRVYESMPRTLTEVADVLRNLARLLDCDDEAQSFVLQIEAQMTRIEVESLERGTVRVFLPIWRKPWMSVNRDTFIHHMLATCGGINVCADQRSRYPTLEDRHLAELGAELVLLPSEPYAFGLREQTQLLQSGMFPGCPVRLVDGRDYSWHGTRTAAALGRIHELLLGYRPRC